MNSLAEVCVETLNQSVVVNLNQNVVVILNQMIKIKIAILVKNVMFGQHQLQVMTPRLYQPSLNQMVLWMLSTCRFASF
jgi:hypothetical protein